MHFSSKKVRGLITTFLFMLVMVYFSYHLVSGEKGLMSMMRLQSQLAATNAEHDSVKLQRIKKQHRVESLYNDSLDVDLLDSQSRNILGLAKENELILFVE